MFKYRKLCVRQQDIADCGPACLVSITSFFGRRDAISTVRQYVNTDTKGTNVFGIVKGCEKLGLKARAVKAGVESLNSISCPAIAHVVKPNGLHHYVVIYKVSNNKITIMDPAYGKIQIQSIESFSKIWSGVLVLFEVLPSFDTVKAYPSPMKQLCGLLGIYKKQLLLIFALALLYSLLGVCMSLYIKEIIDDVIGRGNVLQLYHLSAIMLIIIAVKTLSDYFKSKLSLVIGQKIDTQLILDYYKHIFQLPQSFFDSMRSGELLSRVNDAVKIRDLLTRTGVSQLVNALIIVVSFCGMLIFSKMLTIMVCACIPLFLLAFYFYNKYNKKYLRVCMEDAANLESHLVESLNTQRTIRNFNLHDGISVKSESLLKTFLGDSYKVGMCGIKTQSVLSVITGLICLLILFWGSSMVVSNNLTTGVMMSFYTIMLYMITPLIEMIYSNVYYQDAVIAIDRLFQIMILKKEEENETALVQTNNDVFSEDIIFDNVSFRYGNRANVLKSLSFSIPKGKITAIVGESGSGKSTILSLLMKVYSIQEGSIRFGNHDISYINSKILRENVSIVPQQIELFTGSIATNIAVGSQCIDNEKLDSVLKFCKIDKFISNLPYGVNTMIGDNGIHLSLGEMQRVAIARALYKQPRVLLLDEATSALDSIAEDDVKHWMKQLTEMGTTIVVIAHRFSTIYEADKVLYIENGRVLETGTHSSLVALKGKYYKLWKTNIPID